MELPELKRHALALSERDRASLTLTLLDTLPAPEMDVSDEEVEHREKEMDSGEVEAISHEEFQRRVEQDRNR